MPPRVVGIWARAPLGGLRMETRVDLPGDPVLAYLTDDLAALSQFGIELEIVLVVGSTVACGTLIGEVEYFSKMGEVFEEIVGPAIAQINFQDGSDASNELQQGWNDDQFAELPAARKQGYQMIGEAAHQALRQRVQQRPELLQEFHRNTSAKRKLQAELEEKLLNSGSPERQFIHLRSVSLPCQGETTRLLPYLRIRLSHVSGWSLASRN